MGFDLSAFSEEASFEEPKRPEIEKVVFAMCGHWPGAAIIMWCNGGVVADELSNLGIEVIDYILDDEAPDHGICIWEGRHRVVVRNAYEYESEIEYTTICWREPTEEEWEAIREQRNPFDEPPPPEAWTYGSKTTL